MSLKGVTGRGWLVESTKGEVTVMSCHWMALRARQGLGLGLELEPVFFELSQYSHALVPPRSLVFWKMSELVLRSDSERSSWRVIVEFVPRVNSLIGILVWSDTAS